MITIIETTSQEIETEFQTNYQRFREYYDNTTMKITEILDLLGITRNGSQHKRIRQQLKKDGIDTAKRGSQIKRRITPCQDKTLKDFQDDLRNGMSIEDALIKHDITLAYAFEKMKPYCGQLNKAREAHYRKHYTGYYRVTKNKNSRLAQGFSWTYRWEDDTGKVRTLNSVDLGKLKEKVLEAGLEWKEV